MSQPFITVERCKVAKRSDRLIPTDWRWGILLFFLTTKSKQQLSLFSFKIFKQIKKNSTESTLRPVNRHLLLDRTWLKSCSWRWVFSFPLFFLLSYSFLYFSIFFFKRIDLNLKNDDNETYRLCNAALFLSLEKSELFLYDIRIGILTLPPTGNWRR